MAARPPRPTTVQRVVPAEDTKMQSERLIAEQKAEQQARRGEISMASTVDSADDEYGLWDGQSGELVESALSDEDKETLARVNHLVEDDDGITEFPSEQLYASQKINQPVSPEGAIGPTGVPIFTPEIDPDEIIETVHNTPAPIPDAPMVGAGAQPYKTVVPVKRTEPMEIIRLNADINATIGKDNHWNLQEGRRYRVPRYVAQHLKEKGLVSQVG